MSKIIVEIHGDDYQLEKLLEDLKERSSVDIEFTGGHGQNRTYHPFMGIRLVDQNKCIHVPPSPGQSMCQCKHQQIEMEYAARIAEADDRRPANPALLSDEEREALAWVLEAVDWPHGMGDVDYHRAQADAVFCWLAGQVDPNER